MIVAAASHKSDTGAGSRCALDIAWKGSTPTGYRSSATPNTTLEKSKKDNYQNDNYKDRNDTHMIPLQVEPRTKVVLSSVGFEPHDTRRCLLNRK